MDVAPGGLCRVVFGARLSDEGDTAWGRGRCRRNAATAATMDEATRWQLRGRRNRALRLIVTGCGRLRNYGIAIGPCRRCLWRVRCNACAERPCHHGCDKQPSLELHGKMLIDVVRQGNLCGAVA